MWSACAPVGRFDCYGLNVPQRFLRPGITTSKRFNRVSFEAQTFYIRLITLVDDYGRYEADPELLRSYTFPFGNPDGSEVSLTTIDNICQQLRAKEMVVFYDGNDGKKYLQVTRWKERARSDSKFPEPTREQLLANDNKCSLPSPSPSSQPSPSPSPIPSLPQSEAGGSFNGLPHSKGASASAPVKPPSEIEAVADKLAAIYGRTAPYTRWPYDDQRNLVELLKRPSLNAEIETLIAFKARYRFFPHNLTSLLMKWDATLDAAHNPDIEKKPKSTASKTVDGITRGQ